MVLCSISLAILEKMMTPTIFILLILPYCALCLYLIIKNARGDVTAMRLTAARRQLEVQGQDGNWNYDAYMQGMYNGMECTLATIEGRTPKFRNPPDEWLEGMKCER